LNTYSKNYEIRREPYPWGRAYIVEGLEEDPIILPSVTTVLQLVVNEKYEKLRKEFGEDRWDKIMQDAAERGNILHQMLEIFIIEWEKEGDLDISLKKAQIFAIEEARKGKEGYTDNEYKKIVERGRNLFWNFYHNKFWEEISEVLHSEIFLFTTFKGGWAGTADFVYLDNDKNLIVEDFKSSTSPKDEEDVLAYKLQISAYMFMCAEKYGYVPKMGKIKVSNEMTDDIQVFKVYDYEIKKYLGIFIELLGKFKKMHNI
jgi:hypothetical protein